MPPKIFITGVTGYIGGDVLYALNETHPEYEYTVMVRGSEKGTMVAAAYPKARLVYGNLENAALLEEESAKADIVIDTADSSDHLGAAKAISKGLAAGHTGEKPGYWLHLSGTGVLCWKDRDTNTYGEPPSQPEYDDLDKVSDLTSLPDTAWHRGVDKLVLAASSDVVKTAIICPPAIYGRGRGPDNQRSIQVYLLTETTLKQGQAPQFGRGLSEWGNVHIHDLSNLYTLFVDAIIANKSELDTELFGPKGYFLVENGHHVWGEVSKQVAEEGYKQGFIKTKEVIQITLDGARELGVAALTWGLNSKGHAKRARKYLGWNPRKRLKDEIPDIVASEAVRLGLKIRYRL